MGEVLSTSGSKKLPSRSMLKRYPRDIGELCDSGIVELQTGPFGSQLHAHEYVVSGVPVVPTEAIRDRQIKYDRLPQIDERKAVQLNRHRLAERDILFARRGVQATGHIAFVRRSEVGFVCGTGAIRLRVIKENNAVDAEYLSHVFANPASVAWFKFHAIGATMPNLNEGIIRSFPLSLPDISEQKRAAGFLSALDDKIELNRQMNQTLEAMARAVFLDWFVDFGPTRRKAAGATDPAAILGGLIPNPTQSAPLAALFPDSFGANGLPMGWNWSTVGAELETLLGGTPSRVRKDYWGGHIPWINSGKANEFRVIEASEYITQIGYDNSATKLMPKRTTLIAITGATLGQVSLNETEVCANQSIVGVVGNDKLSSEYVYCWVKENIDKLVAAQTGGAQQHINKNNVNDLAVIVPHERIINAWSGFSIPLFDLIAQNCFENQTLAATRDLLLPKLMSGELRLVGGRP